MQSPRFFTTVARKATDPRRVSLKHLPYEIGALEPVLSGKVMEFHYSKHHRTYVTNLNNLLEQQAECTARGDLRESIALSKLIHFNAGGHLNHEFFWDSLCPKEDSALPDPGSDLHKAIEAQFHSMDEFIHTFNKNTANIQGSGWGWLCYNVKKGMLSYRKTLNQDMIVDVSPELRPLLNIDIWEHAYYLDYKN